MSEKVNQMRLRIAADDLPSLCSGSGMKVRQQLSADSTSQGESTPPPSTSTYPPTRGTMGTYATLGILCAIISLFIVPEISGAAAIILGAYTWRIEQGNRGIAVVILGII